jgi:hypothetical protein
MNDAGNVSLELRTPFAYLRDLTEEIRTVKKQSKRRKTENKTGDSDTAGSPGACSSQLQSCGKDWITFEHLSPLETTQFLDSLPFPQRKALAPFITNPN